MLLLLNRGAPRVVALTGIGLAAAIGIAALGSAVGLPALPEPLAELDRRLPGVFEAHMMAAGLGLILLPWILLVRRRPSLHRVLGRIGAGLLFVAAATALPSALHSEAVPLARLGFFAQGVVCLVLVAGGVHAIRRGETERHARLMVRLSAVVSGAIVLRVLMAMAMSLGLPFDGAYASLAWLSWLLPLAVVALWPAAARRPNWPNRPTTAVRYVSASSATPAVAMISSPPGNSHIHQASRR